jgi:hypothetical protein
MSVRSGVYAAVNGIATLRNWVLSRTSSTKPYVASNTLGGTGRRRGVIDWSGSLSQYGGIPDAMPGETFAFAGYTSPGTGVLGDDGTVYAGNAIVDSVAVNWNWETGDPINISTNFGGNGPLTSSQTDAVVDETFPAVPTPLELPFQILDLDGGSGGWSEICDVTSATLNITAANKTYANSCTDGIMMRKPGPIDWTLSVTFQNDDFMNGFPFDINDVVGFRLPVDETNYWELLWGIVQGYSNFTVDRETGNIIAVTVNFEMCGFDHDTESVGRIVLPGAAEPWWGEAA